MKHAIDYDFIMLCAYLAGGGSVVFSVCTVFHTGVRVSVFTCDGERTELCVMFSVRCSHTPVELTAFF